MHRRMLVGGGILLTFNNKQILETSVVSVTYVIGDITFERTIGVERRYIPFNIRD